LIYSIFLDLWKFLFDGLPDGTVRFGRTIEDFGEDLMKPSIDGNVYDTVIVADGGFSTLRKFVNGYDKKPEYAGHMIYRVKLDNREFPEFNAEGGYTEGRAFIMLLKVAPSDGSKWLMGGVAVPVPESEVTRPQDGANRQDLVATQSVPDWFMPYVRKTFARSGGGQVVRWLELAAEKGKITPQPLFEFAADRVTAGRLILVGDAAHMASPRTAVGAHTGVLDAAGLLEAFGKYGSAIDQAIGAYAPGGLKRAKDLCARSKEVSKPLVYTPEGDDRRSEL
jgi:2-polyprenyl-6-methoxyphenol hydroxylase-like FAD-dependent oxidoreductase